MERVFSCFLKVLLVSAVWRLAALSTREEQRGAERVKVLESDFVPHCEETPSWRWKWASIKIFFVTWFELKNLNVWGKSVDLNLSDVLSLKKPMLTDEININILLFYCFLLFSCLFRLITLMQSWKSETLCVLVRNDWTACKSLIILY